MVLDESGLLLAPLVRRSWARRGHPPVLPQKAGHREKVAVAAGLWLTPQRDRLGLAVQTLVNGYFNNAGVATFLEDVLGQLRGPLVVVWDGGSMPKGDPSEEVVEDWAGRLVLEPLPA